MTCLLSIFISVILLTVLAFPSTEYKLFFTAGYICAAAARNDNVLKYCNSELKICAAHCAAGTRSGNSGGSLNYAETMEHLYHNKVRRNKEQRFLSWDYS